MVPRTLYIDVADVVYVVRLVGINRLYYSCFSTENKGMTM